MAQGRVGFFGGSFDPPHRGHLAVVKAAAEAFALERVLLVPTARQPLKPDGATAGYADRLEMVSLLCEGWVGLEASALDAPLADGGANYTIDTLRRLKHELGSGDSVFVIVGADAFLGLQQWREPEGLLAAAEWVVVTRPGVSLDRLDAVVTTQEQRTRVHVLADVEEPVSATEIRERLHEGRNCEELVPPGVLGYIYERHLYGA
jgi:nicotinate-nucleotide adenylyltransferase